MSNIIELKQVDKIYQGAIDTKALSGISLTIEKGSFNSIVGESGSGKSTLLNIMGTLDRPTAGEMVIDGQSTSHLSNNGLAALRNRTIGFVFQFHYLLPEFTALENVLIPYQIGREHSDRETKLRAAKLFEMMGLERVKNNMANRMSGGQQQRTAIARALINNPSIFLADEPTGNLDSENTAHIYKLLRDINVNFGTTFIIVTHDRKIAEQTDRIIEIMDGRIVSDLRNQSASLSLPTVLPEFFL
jgi:lipoprotein-releasing system ATP-binding protein